MTLPYSPAAERNREPIVRVLEDWLPAAGSVLEIGSGSGQHAVAFARHFPRLAWQPSEHPAALAGLEARVRAEGGPGLRAPVALDVRSGPWPAGPFDAAFSANTAHIMAWDAVEAMFAGVSRVLVPGAPFCLYGPFLVDGAPTTTGNRAFDERLRAGDEAMGLRDIGALDSLAREHQMTLEERRAMPADNFMLRFRRRSDDDWP